MTGDTVLMANIFAVFFNPADGRARWNSYHLHYTYDGRLVSAKLGLDDGKLRPLTGEEDWTKHWCDWWITPATNEEFAVHGCPVP